MIRSGGNVSAPQRPIPLGPFTLEARIGVGGMGEVWRGVHRQQRVPVAVKVITAARARQDRYREAFREEVRAVAGLDHPGVVHVLDLGEVGAEAEAASEGALVAGSPYLAMELATAGALAQRPWPTRWDRFRGELIALLDVLGHAHARGVIHRDLKLGNILVFDPPVPEAPQRLALADFGLAHATDRAERSIRGTSGTPLYMAPEQFRGHWRDFGPWTDLYALGCLAFLLTSGQPPFPGQGFSALMQLHLHAEPSRLVPQMPVPDGFESWLRRLLAKDTLDRYQCAADAAEALLRLGEPQVVGPALPFDTPDLASAATVTLSPSFLAWVDQNTLEDADEAPTEEVVIPGRSLLPRRPPVIPMSWRRDDPPRIDVRLVGAGLGLYGLRAIPLVGREPERDRVWSALRGARASSEARLILLQGQAGAGKSRLAEWIGQRAVESGAATLVRAEHSPGGGPTDGLPQLIARVLGCLGLPRHEVVRRTRTWLARRGVHDDYEWQALMEVMWPEPDTGRGPNRPVRFERPSERYAVIHRLLAHHSRCGESPDGRALHRPVILWLDDIQWGSDALGLAEYLLRNGADGPCPLLVLCTARVEALPDRPENATRLEQLLTLPRAERIELGALDRSQRSALVQTLLGLEGALAQQVVDRTDGNPLFMVQLIGDWVQRGVLEVRGSGFALREGARADLPDDIHALWAERIARVLDHRPETAREALELAAVLGNTVDRVEWRGACNVARLAIPADLEAELIGRRLAISSESGWSFAHGMLRESLERAAREDGRWERLHDAAATTLQIRLATTRQPGLSERVGRHLYEAGRLAEALDPLRDGAGERRRMSDYGGAMPLLELWWATMEALPLDPQDLRWGEAQILRADLLTSLGRLPDAESVALDAVERAEAQGWRELLPAALRHAGNVTAKRGTLDQARGHYLRAIEAAEHIGDDEERARSLLALGDVARLRGDPEAAVRSCRRALQLFVDLGDVRGQGDAVLGLAGVARSQGDYAALEKLARRAITLYEGTASRFGLASCHNNLGEVLRGRGDLPGAEDAYRRAEALFHGLGSSEALVPRINLGLVLVARGRHAEARVCYEQALASAARDGRRGLIGILRALLLPCLAAAADREAWAEHAPAAAAALGQAGLVDRDIAWSAELAGDLAATRREAAVALEAWALARAQWEGLSAPERAEIVTAKIQALNSSLPV